MSTTVVFAMTARAKLEQRLARGLAQGRTAEGRTLEGQMDAIRQLIQERQVFPGAAVAVVRDLYAGFRVRDGEHILLVEVAESGDRDGLSVVKLGPPARLAEEWQAWTDCRPHGLRHDIVLMDLQRVPRDGGEIAALVYADAQQFIGVDQTLPLEDAVDAAVRLGEPALDSVADVFFQLYERLGLLLYRHSFDADPAADPLFAPHDLDRNLLANLAAWNTASDLAEIRSTASTQADTLALFRRFRDPVALFETLLRQGAPGEHMPRMLRGRSHGDLHARNVLVGRINDRVLWPAVYDFGGMGRANWIGWDFVKMEVELKIRLYPHLFPGLSAADILPFEVRLSEATEHGRAHDRWPPLAGLRTPADRLHALLADLRRLAGRHLGQHGRSRLWLAEYYFQLALYGLNAGRFHNLSRLELQAAYLAAGAAAARFAPVPERRPRHEAP